VLMEASAESAEARRRAKNLERVRRYQAAHPDRVRETKRKYREKNPTADAEYQQRYRETHPRKRYPPKPRGPAKVDPRLPRHKMARGHGNNWHLAYATFWDAQAGRCYLCGDPLNPEVPQDIAMDHNHDCCPPRQSCDICRRGLACGRRNKLVGLADENPERLHRIADALIAANERVRLRMPEKPIQDAMF
jgi:Recombination endonuclease VII